MNRTLRTVLASLAVGFALVVAGGNAAGAVEGQTCISDDGKTYPSGSLNGAGTHRCRNGTWDKVGISTSTPSPTLASSGSATAQPATAQPATAQPSSGLAATSAR